MNQSTHAWIVVLVVAGSCVTSFLTLCRDQPSDRTSVQTAPRTTAEQQRLSSEQVSTPSLANVEIVRMTADEVTNDEKPIHRRAVTILKSRRYTVTVYTSSAGPRFDVVSSDGTYVRNNIPLVALRSDLPDIYELYRTGYAEAWAGLDAAAR